MDWGRGNSLKPVALVHNLAMSLNNPFVDMTIITIEIIKKTLASTPSRNSARDSTVVMMMRAAF